MIIFYDKKDGRIFSYMDGRVHDRAHLKCSVNAGIEEVGKYIIGWIEDEDGKIEYNMDKLKILQSFEDHTETSPLDYKIDVETGQLIKK